MKIADVPLASMISVFLLSELVTISQTSRNIVSRSVRLVDEIGQAGQLGPKLRAGLNDRSTAELSERSVSPADLALVSAGA